jgi:hypothetical protein
MFWDYTDNVVTLLKAVWRLPQPILDIMFMPFGFIAPKTLNYLAFQSFDFECTWWRLFQGRVVRTKFDIYFFMVWIWHVFIFHLKSTKETKCLKVSKMCFVFLYVNFLFSSQISTFFHFTFLINFWRWIITILTWRFTFIEYSVNKIKAKNTTPSTHFQHSIEKRIAW